MQTKMLAQALIASMAILFTGVASAADSKGRTTKAKATAGVKAATENLKESMLNAKIRMVMLKTLSGADSLRVGITVKGTTASLNGEVEDRASEKLAVESAKSVEGISAVNSRITLNPSAPHQDNMEAGVKDALLVTEVKLQLFKEVGEHAIGIHVTAAGGAVSLRGEMPNNSTRTRALETVKSMPSVARVEDLMSTTP